MYYPSATGRKSLAVRNEFTNRGEFQPLQATTQKASYSSGYGTGTADRWKVKKKGQPTGAQGSVTRSQSFQLSRPKCASGFHVRTYSETYGPTQATLEPLFDSK